MTETGIIDHVFATISPDQGAVRAVRYNVDGNYCLSCGSDKTLKLWNPTKGILLKTYSGHGYEVLDASGSCDNSQLTSCGLDKTVILWDVASGKLLRKYRSHAGTVNCVEFNEDSTIILSGSIDGTMRAWDVRSRANEPIQVMSEFKDSVTSIDVSDHEILAGSADGQVRRYDLRAGEMNADLVGKSVTSVKFTRDGQCTLSSTLDDKIRLLDKETGELLNEYTGHKNTSYKIDSCLNHKDTHIISGSEDGKLYIWDLVDAEIKKTLTFSESGRVCHSISHHSEKSQLLVASGSKIYVLEEKAASTT